MSTLNFDPRWADVRAAIAHGLATTRHPQHLFVEVVAADASVRGRYVQYCVHASGSVRAEVSSNQYLDESAYLDAVAVERLFALGWQMPSHRPEDTPDPGSPNYYMDIDGFDADAVADMAVTVCRIVFGIYDPRLVRVTR